MASASNSGGIFGGRRSICSLFRVSLLVAMSVSAARADFNYPNFNSVAGLTLNGSASQVGSVLQLTPNLEGQSGTTWRTVKAHVSNGFDTTFTFRMATNGADGMAFVIQDSAHDVIGNGGSGLAYQDIGWSLAVEIDTFGFFPETENHISVQTRGVTPNSAEDLYSLAQYNVYSFNQDLNDGSTHSMTIRYRPGFLLVFLDGGIAPIINIPLDLTNIDGDNILDGSGDAWVGFTAATGGVFQTQEVHNWNFDETSDPLPIGGCCTAAGCVTSDARNCGANLSGHYAGDGTDCVTVNCSGACCYVEGCFWPATIQNCADEPGTFMGVGSECLEINCEGACCTPSGACIITFRFDCIDLEQGVFHGSGTSCVPMPCPLPQVGGCCDASNECLMKTQAQCTTDNGTWYGQGTSCFDVSCFDPPGPFGACCQPGGTCVEAVKGSVCELYNGIYNGDDSICANSVCSSSCDCQTAMPITGTAFFSDSTTLSPSCDIALCTGVTSPSPANIYAVTLANGGQLLVNTCNSNNFDTIITVHSGCPMTAENMVACDNDDVCAPGSQVFFCAAAGVTYYVRVGGVGGASGDYLLLVIDFGSRVLEGPFQNPANGHWYYLTAHGTWVLNEQLAIAKGGHLVTINDAAENEWVRSTFTPINNSGLLIGINDAVTEGTFAWPNGDAVGYTNWDSGQPDDTGGNEDYGFMKTDGKWADQTDCPIHNSGEAVLEVNTLILPGLLTGPIANPANCSTYYLTQPGTWIETQLKAQAMGGNLVTINNAAENEFVRANFVIDLPPAWIGLHDSATEGTFVWADGTPFAYSNWMDGEPNNVGNEDYVAMADGSTGKWNDSQGGGPLSGVIEVSGSCLLGDLNCSGSVTVADIPNFILALLGGPGFPGCNINLADINGDTLRNGRDIKPFVALLTP